MERKKRIIDNFGIFVWVIFIVKFSIEGTKSRQQKRDTDPSISSKKSEMPAVVVVHQGASYNPDMSSHKVSHEVSTSYLFEIESPYKGVFPGIIDNHQGFEG